MGYILVVDEFGTGEHLSSLLETEGLQARRCATGEEALIAARRERPDLVLAEVRLPGVSGYEVVRGLRQRYGETLPIMLLSADRTDTIDRVAGLLLGADDYVAKPYAPDELIARVQRLLARSGAEPQRVDKTTLTRRQQDVLRLLAQGMGQDDIARELFISSKTVASHIQNLLPKLGVHSRAQAVALAHRKGLFSGT